MKIANSGKTVQFFDPNAIISEMHVIGSYINALSAVGGGSNIAKSVAVEMLLFAALTRQIGPAIEKVGAKSEKNLLVFAESNTALKPLKKYFATTKKFSPDTKQKKRPPGILA